MKRKNEAGFTLIELVMVIVILGIISAVAIPKLGSIMSQSKIEATRSELRVIKDAINGDHGYRVTVGSDPSGFDDLMTKPVGVAAWDKYTAIGWDGPYIDDASGTGDWKLDAWDNAYIWGATTLVSYGPDGASGGGDDITLQY